MGPWFVASLQCLDQDGRRIGVDVCRINDKRCVMAHTFIYHCSQHEDEIVSMITQWNYLIRCINNWTN